MPTVDTSPSSSSPSTMPEAGEAGYSITVPLLHMRELSQAIAHLQTATEGAPVDLLALNETIPRAELVAWLRKAQAAQADAEEEARRIDSRLTIAEIERDALLEQLHTLHNYGDPAHPLSVARALLGKVDLHEFAEGLQLIAEAREWMKSTPAPAPAPSVSDSERHARESLLEAGIADPSIDLLRARIMLDHAQNARDLALRGVGFTSGELKVLDDAEGIAANVYHGLLDETRRA